MWCIRCQTILMKFRRDVHTICKMVSHVRLINLYWSTPPRFTTSFILIFFLLPLRHVYSGSVCTVHSIERAMVFIFVHYARHRIFSQAHGPTYELYLCAKCKLPKTVCARVNKYLCVWGTLLWRARARTHNCCRRKNHEPHNFFFFYYFARLFKLTKNLREWRMKNGKKMRIIIKQDFFWSLARAFNNNNCFLSSYYSVKYINFKLLAITAQKWFNDLDEMLRCLWRD